MDDTEKIIIDDFTDDDEIKQDNNIWDYKQPGATIIGIVTKIFEEGTYGKEITVDDGKEPKLLPSLTALKTKLADVKLQDKIKVVCLGEVMSANRKKYYDFQVFIKPSESEVKEVSSQTV